jgi:hypothetical protein
MSAAKHTPGPWLWIDEGRRLNSPSGLVIDSAAYEGMWFARYDKEEDEANKRLMEAAPGLLSIAERWAALDAGSWHQVRYENEKAELLADTRFAIAKATGCAA